MDPNRAVRLNIGAARNSGFIAIAAVLPTHDVSRRQRPHRPKDLDLLAALGVGGKARWWFHRQQRDHLEEMILHHIAQAASPPNAELLRQRDLHAGHVVAVPDRLKKGIGESEVEDALHRFLAEKVVDTEDRVLGKDPMRRAVQSSSGREVASKGLLDDDSCPAGHVCRPKLFDDICEEGRRDCEVVRRVGRLAESRF